MIRSMTGYGEAERELPEGRLRASVKTVNHRFFNAHLKIPSGLDRSEAELQGWLRAFFSRGHVNFSLTLERDRDASAQGLPKVDWDRAQHFAMLFRELRERLGLSGGGELDSLLRFGEILQAPEGPGQAPEMDPRVLREVTEEAARMALEMREKEGARLEVDLRERLAAMEGHLAIAQERAPLRLLAERERLQAAIRELSQQEGVDPDRLAKEVAYLAERWDINEEIVRLKAHLQAFREAMKEGNGDPVGKRLGFLVQEMHREANTIASKANDLEMSRASVAIREEIERLREQLENVE